MIIDYFIFYQQYIFSKICNTFKHIFHKILIYYYHHLIFQINLEGTNNDYSKNFSNIFHNTILVFNFYFIIFDIIDYLVIFIQIIFIPLLIFINNNHYHNLQDSQILNKFYITNNFGIH